MKIYEVSKETYCNDEWNTSCYAYPEYETLKYFSTREKAEAYIQSYQCDTIDTLFDGQFNAKEVKCRSGYQREFIADDEYYNYFGCLLRIDEIEIE